MAAAKTQECCSRAHDGRITVGDTSWFDGKAWKCRDVAGEMVVEVMGDELWTRRNDEDLNEWLNTTDSQEGCQGDRRGCGGREPPWKQGDREDTAVENRGVKP